ncbi:MAG: 2Fe-2S iron-sulfur cluster-binding protein [Bacillota bacterium]
MEVVNLTIDGLAIEAEKGKTILDVALANGIYIPYLCHHPELIPAGFCRVCMVEVKGKFVVSCRTPIAEGMEVKTKGLELDKYRRAIVGIIITEHDTDCLSCEKNLNCKLQEVAQFVGIDPVARKELRNIEMDKPIDDTHPWIVRNYNRCIMCGICVRTCDEIQQISAVNYAFRGRETKISTLGDKPLMESNCVSCGECVVRCPVGALVPKRVDQADQDIDPAVLEKIQSATVTITPSTLTRDEKAEEVVTEEIKLIIDDVVVSVGKGSTVLQAAQKAGIYIPYLCYHPELKGSGGCKVCTVDINGKLLPSCAAPAREGTVVVTNSPQVQEAQAAAVKKMLAGHRGECLNCAKNGRCKLQEVAGFVGVYLEMAGVPEPLMEVDESNPYFLIDRSRCVTCGVCIRACKQVKGADALEFKRVDNQRKVLHKEGIDLAGLGCESCGACVVRCPVGALLPKGAEPPFMRIPPGNPLR